MLSHEVDPKLPTWDGQWAGFTDYVTRVELKADGTKNEELPLLGPRLAANLTSRAFEWIVDADRSKLRSDRGWAYLIEFLKNKRQHSKLDILGEEFSGFFLRKDAWRKEGESLAEFENRFRSLTRKLEKAMKESGCATSGLPTEVYGWFLINVFVRLDPSDTANVRGRAEDYKEDTVWKALHRMWSGDGLAQKDNEKKRQGVSKTYHASEMEEESEILQADSLEDSDAVDLEEAVEWYQDAQQQMLSEPDCGEVLANFREARKALDRARTARGYYPTRKPLGSGPPKNRGTGNQYSADYSEKICMRCGKKGHIARLCRQKMPTTDSKPKGSSVNFVGTVFSNDEPNTALLACEKSDGATDVSVSYFNMDEMCRGKAILDSGASDNIVGAETLQTLSEMYQEMDFDPQQEIEVDRNIHKRFVFGNNQTSSGLGLGHINTGICGKELKIQAHVVEGATPFLLSSKFLYDMAAEVDFRTGKAVFHALSEDVIQLERTPNHHLLLPLTAFAGNVAMLASLMSSSTSSTEGCGVKQTSVVAEPVISETHDKGTEH